MTGPEEPGLSPSTPVPEPTPDVSTALEGEGRAEVDASEALTSEPGALEAAVPEIEEDVRDGTPVQEASSGQGSADEGSADEGSTDEGLADEGPADEGSAGEDSPDRRPTGPTSLEQDRVIEVADPEPSDRAEPPGSTGPAEPPAPMPPSTPWRRLMSACKPHVSRAQVLAAVLCAVLGFALVVQLRQTKQDEFANLRQSDLVRILDDVTRRSEDLDRELSSLLKTEFELRSGTDSQRAALELAEQDAATQGILSGRLPAEGPGVEITIVEGTTKISASRMFNVLEELRNAGAEVIEVNGIRMVTSSYFVDADRGIVIDGIAASAPYRWAVIGDPVTLEPAMEIPGGALPTIRVQGGTTTIEQHELVEVKAVREPEEPEFATPGVDAG